MLPEITYTAASNPMDVILPIACTVIGAILAAFVIPLLKRNLDDQKLDKLQRYIGIAVSAAEQLHGSDSGLSKLSYVEDFIKGKGFDVGLSELRTLIESAVYELKSNEPQPLISEPEEADSGSGVQNESRPDDDDIVDESGGAADITLSDDSAADNGGYGDNNEGGASI